MIPRPVQSSCLETNIYTTYRSNLQFLPLLLHPYNNLLTSTLSDSCAQYLVYNSYKNNLIYQYGLSPPNFHFVANPLYLIAICIKAMQSINREKSIFVNHPQALVKAPNLQWFLFQVSTPNYRQMCSFTYKNCLSQDQLDAKLPSHF